MEQTRIKLFRHQQQLVQLPYIKPNIEYFFDIAGYGSGKTSVDVYLLMSLIERYFRCNYNTSKKDPNKCSYTFIYNESYFV